MENTRTLSIIKISLMTVIIILCGWITVPAPVPFTMQTFGIYAAVLLTGSKKAFVSTALYILMGLAGLPVFSGFSSGGGYISGPTGGYLFGFLLIPLLCLLGEKIFPGKKIITILLSSGTVLCYITGTVWFTIVSSKAEEKAGLWTAVAFCVLPYIIPDAIKLFAAHHISKKLKPILNKSTKD